MTRLRALLDELERRGDRAALIHAGRTHSYAELCARRREWSDHLAEVGVEPGTVVAVRTDYSPAAIALLLALLERGAVAAMLPLGGGGDDDALLADARAAGVYRVEPDGAFAFERRADPGSHPLLDRLRDTGSGGFVIFTSGSTGRPKAVLHDIERFLIKYERPGKPLRTLAFLLFDHIAGMDTLFYALAAGGSLVLPDSRAPHAVCRLIDAHRVEVLPTSPTFLRLALLSGAADEHDLGSLRIVTYGSEPMDAATLAQVEARFAHTRVIQKYGTSELGSPRSRSRDDDSLWIDLETDDVEARIEDGVLWLRSKTAMLGYLNAEQPIDADGWYCTGDRVEREGSFIRFVGRESDVINVGGEKVLPHEVETVILELDYVREAAVRGVAHPLLGQVVHAEVAFAPDAPEDAAKAVRRHCRGRLLRHQVPVKVVAATGALTSERQKKRRRGPAEG